MTADVVERLRVRHVVQQAIRDHFHEDGFLEVEPPSLVVAPGMEPHITALEVVVEDGRSKRSMWLHTSPEFAMKKLLGAGAQRIYAMPRVFRAGEHGPHHRVEFTMLEWYRAHTAYDALMRDCEGFISRAARALNGSTRVGNLDLTPPFERLTLAEAFQKHAGVDLLKYLDPLDGPGLQQAAKKAGISIVSQPGEDPLDAFERAFYEVMLARVEPAIGLTRPTFLYEWPAPLAALSRISERDARVAERVELYAAGLELGNGFGELTDAAEQERRFTAEQQRRAHLGKPVYPVDPEFLAALRTMPPSTGMAVGLDRIVLLLTGQGDFANVLTLDR